MIYVINTNVSALNANANSFFNSRVMVDSLEKLSSGLRINKASDDASGLSIANMLRSQANAYAQSIKSANDAIGLIQIADKAMDEQINILNNIKQKATQAAQDGQNSQTRRAIQADIVKLLEGLDNIASTTSYNGQKLLSGDYSGKEFQIGAYSNQTIRLSIGSTSSSKIGHLRLETTPTLSSSINLSCTSLNFKVGNKSIAIAGVRISTSVGTGIGVLSEQINRYIGDIGIKTHAKTKSSAQDSIKAGDVKGLVINGVTIGDIEDVKAHDSDGRLVGAINSAKLQTGIEATVDIGGRLHLCSVDGRGIYIESRNRNRDGYQIAHLDLNPTGNYVNPQKVNDGVITAGFEITFNNTNTYKTTKDYSTVAKTGASRVQSEFEEWLDGVVKTQTQRGGAFANDNRGFLINQFLNREEGDGATITLRANGREIEEVLGIKEGSGSFGEGARIVNYEGSKEEFVLGEEFVMSIVSAQASNFGRLSMSYNGAYDITVSTKSACNLFEGNNSQRSLNLQGALASWDMDTACAAGVFGNLIDASLSYSRIDNVGVSTLKGAMVVMDIADSAISQLSNIRSDLGSAQIQITSTLNNITVTEVNTRAAQSNIRDVNFAEVSELYNKTMILAKSGSYALSQANRVKENIFTLFS